MRRYLALILVLFATPAVAHETLAEGVRDLATQISTAATKQSKQKIAVLPLRELDGQPTILGTYIAEELITGLVQLGSFDVVERQLLDKLLGEQKIEQTGAIDPATAKKVGKILGVDAIVTGSITDLTTFMAVNCRLIDTSTGAVFGAARVTIAKDADVTKLTGTALTETGTAARTPTYAPPHAVATKDFGSLRIALTSITQNGLRWTFDVTNRDAQVPVVVAMNAENPAEYGVRIGATPTVLRASVSDDYGNIRRLDSSGLEGLGFVRAGVRGQNGHTRYSPLEIIRLLELRDRLGRNTDDPSDVQEGVTTYTTWYGSGPPPPAPPPFAYSGNEFVTGTPTTIAPGETTVVTMTFEGPPSTAASFQFHAELVVRNSGRYELHNLAFERVSISPSH
jgi:curli biogenesis system outer membrane secretion channel CsgG